jgi:restriction endonuclease S subunit
MAGFKLSEKVNSNKVFILKNSELENRLDPFYYIPEIKELEIKVRKKDVKPLRFFVKNISSGATPKTEEVEKYYSDKENGIPFLRVQNLSPSGILEYDDCKYINKETHNGYLKRSQVQGGDLLVKITGVGRMAVASVAPDGFIGNTNQHMVVIKTESKEVSTILASYLNSDIGEKLASRRATGGTRPALDYPSLLSIPILFDKRILELTENAVEKKNIKQNEAKQLILSIDEYLLKELAITLPKKNNSLENRIFTTSLSEISGGRIDPFYLTNCIELPISSNYKEIEIHNIAKVEKGQSITSAEVITGIYPVIAGGQSSPYSHNNYNQKGKVITISASGAYSGFVWFHTDKIFASDCSVIRSKDEKIASTEFIYNVLKLKQQQLYNLQQGSGQPHVYPSDIKRIKIPLPRLEKQVEINAHINLLRSQAQQLDLDAIQIMFDAKVEVENIILEK